MSNHWRGEMQAVLGGQQYALCLTLGALAELETALGGEDIIAFTERLSQGRIHAADIMHVFAAALRGAGNDIASEDVAQMMPPGGISEAIQIVAQLITLAFSGGMADGSQPASPEQLKKKESLTLKNSRGRA